MHTFGPTLQPMSDSPHRKPKSTNAKYKENRTTVYFRNPKLWKALQAVVAGRKVNARSASERLEQLIATEIRRHAPWMRKNGIIIPPEVFD